MQAFLRQSFPLITFGKTPVVVHKSFLFLVLFIALQVIFSESGGALSHTFVRVVAIVVSLLVHEFGHVFAARTNGFRSVVMLWALGGITFPSGRRSGWREIWTSSAGPLAGFLLAFALIPFAPSGFWDAFSQGDFKAADATFVTFGDEFWRWMMFINIFWSFINLFPILPLDGGQILRDFLGLFMKERRAVKFAAAAGSACAVILAMFFMIALGDLFGGLLFLYLALQNIAVVRMER